MKEVHKKISPSERETIELVQRHKTGRAAVFKQFNQVVLRPHGATGQSTADLLSTLGICYEPESKASAEADIETGTWMTHRQEDNAKAKKRAAKELIMAASDSLGADLTMFGATVSSEIDRDPRHQRSLLHLNPYGREATGTLITAFSYDPDNGEVSVAVGTKTYNPNRYVPIGGYMDSPALMGAHPNHTASSELDDLREKRFMGLSVEMPSDTSRSSSPENYDRNQALQAIHQHYINRIVNEQLQPGFELNGAGMKQALSAQGMAIGFDEDYIRTGVREWAEETGTDLTSTDFESITHDLLTMDLWGITNHTKLQTRVSNLLYQIKNPTLSFTPGSDIGSVELIPLSAIQCPDLSMLTEKAYTLQNYNNMCLHYQGKAIQWEYGWQVLPRALNRFYEHLIQQTSRNARGKSLFANEENFIAHLETFYQIDERQLATLIGEKPSMVFSEENRDYHHRLLQLIKLVAHTPATEISFENLQANLERPTSDSLVLHVC